MPDSLVRGKERPGHVLVVTRRDADGEPIESAWVDESIAWQYDETRWSEKL
ncbi:hypothetical protein J2Y69_002765 [Microbacterium resistens]|uniref:Uncharacterized protein n=1 Tax=Microbacterium resistens TaxID=156977 RepID=A0ABU1SEW7_9MICO|nr:hypothetical protein [Microbacterium resistens]MDR6868154.1 hypothetical protein [Microbacterium resistens]